MSDGSTCSSIESQVFNTYAQCQQLESQTQPAFAFSQSQELLNIQASFNQSQSQPAYNHHSHQPHRLNNFQSQESLLRLYSQSYQQSQQPLQYSNQPVPIQQQLQQSSTNPFEALNNLDSQLPDLPVQKRSLLQVTKPSSSSSQQVKNNNTNQQQQTSSSSNKKRSSNTTTDKIETATSPAVILKPNKETVSQLLRKLPWSNLNHTSSIYNNLSFAEIRCLLKYKHADMPTGAVRKSDLCERLLELLQSGEFDVEASMFKNNGANCGGNNNNNNYNNNISTQNDGHVSRVGGSAGGFGISGNGATRSNAIHKLNQPPHIYQHGSFQYTSTPPTQQMTAEVINTKITHPTTTSSAQLSTSTTAVFNNANNRHHLQYILKPNDQLVNFSNHQPQSTKETHTIESTSSPTTPSTPLVPALQTSIIREPYFSPQFLNDSHWKPLHDTECLNHLRQSKASTSTYTTSNTRNQGRRYLYNSKDSSRAVENISYQMIPQFRSVILSDNEKNNDSTNIWNPVSDDVAMILGRYDGQFMAKHCIRKLMKATNTVESGMYKRLMPMKRQRLDVDDDINITSSNNNYNNGSTTQSSSTSLHHQQQKPHNNVSWYRIQLESAILNSNFSTKQTGAKDNYNSSSRSVIQQPPKEENDTDTTYDQDNISINTLFLSNNNRIIDIDNSARLHIGIKRDTHTIATETDNMTSTEETAIYPYNSNNAPHPQQQQSSTQPQLQQSSSQLSLTHLFPLMCRHGAVRLVLFHSLKLGLVLNKQVVIVSSRNINDNSNSSNNNTKEIAVAQAKNPTVMATDAFQLIQVGDELVSIGNICPLDTYSFVQQLELIKTAPRPLVLGFIK